MFNSHDAGKYTITDLHISIMWSLLNIKGWQITSVYYTCWWILCFQGRWRNTHRCGGRKFVGRINHPSREVRWRVGGRRKAIDTLPFHSRTSTGLPSFLVATVQLLNELVHDWRKTNTLSCSSVLHLLPSHVCVHCLPHSILSLSLSLPPSSSPPFSFSNSCSLLLTLSLHFVPVNHTAFKLTLWSPQQLMSDYLLCILRVRLLCHASWWHVLPVTALRLTDVFLPPMTKNIIQWTDFKRY